MLLLDEMGARVSALGWDDLSERALAWARLAITDTVGVALGGANDPTTLIVKSVVEASASVGTSLILGSRTRRSALEATLVNGTAAHVLDYDDGNEDMGGHPSAMLVPALLALGEHRGSDGRAFVLAYAAGFEVAIRLARGVNLHHYEKGWHPTSTLGIFGATAACARLLGLNAERTATALAIAVSQASGLKANFGTMTKSLHVGHASRCALFAALLAEQGFSANHAAMEAKQGFLNVYNGPGTFDVGRILSSWGAPLELESRSNAVKPYPCCASTHSAVAAAIEIQRARHPEPDAISRVEVLTHRRRIPHTDKPHLESALAGKFSMQYVVARALHQGTLSLGDFEGDAHCDPTIRRLMARVQLLPDPDLTDNASNQFGARLRVIMASGERFDSAIDQYPGPTPHGKIDRQQLWQKFADCAGRALPQERIAPLFAALENIEAHSVSDLVALMQLP